VTAERDTTAGAIPVAKACELASVSRSWYYDRRKRKPRDDTALQDEIEKIVVEFPGYGYRRVTRVPSSIIVDTLALLPAPEMLDGRLPV